MLIDKENADDTALAAQKLELNKLDKEDDGDEESWAGDENRKERTTTMTRGVEDSLQAQGKLPNNRVTSVSSSSSSQAQPIGVLRDVETSLLSTAKLRRTNQGPRISSSATADDDRNRKLGAVYGIGSSRSNMMAADSTHSITAEARRHSMESRRSSHRSTRQRQQQQVLPGAYPQRGINRQFSNDDDASDYLWTMSNHDLLEEAVQNEIDVDDFIYMYDASQGTYSQTVAGGTRRTAPAIAGAGGSSDGLVEAMPVAPLPAAMEAEPVDVEALQQEQAKRAKQQEKARKSNQQQACFLGIGFLLLMVALVVAIAMLSNDKSPTSQVALENPSSSSNSSTAAPTTPELPFMKLLPSATQETIRSSLESNSSNNNKETTPPQARAYQWMGKDPLLGNFSDARLLQRFALATLYYSTGGEYWKHQGGETTTIEFFTPPFPGRPPPGGGPPPQGVGGGPPPPPGSGGGGPPPQVGGGGGGGGGQRPQGAGGGGPPPPQGAGGGPPPPPGSGGGPPPPPGAGGPGRPPLLPPTPFYSDKWLSYHTHECGWFNVFMGNPYEVICDEHDNLLKLNLLRNNLTATLPEELGLLSKLTHLMLRHNFLKGTILPVSRLPSLVSAHINECQFSGTIPTELASLSNTLQQFSILRNRVSGSIPSELLQLSLLQLLKLSRNELTGTLPDDICEYMPNLSEFRLDDNYFHGTLPASLQNCSNMRLLEVGGNQLTGTLPTWLGGLSNVLRLTLPDNQLVGTIPSELGLLPAVHALWLYDNPQLNGTIPVELENLNDTLIELRLKGTNLTGTIPSGLCRIHKLRFDCSPDSGLCGCGCRCNLP